MTPLSVRRLSAKIANLQRRVESLDDRILHAAVTRRERIQLKLARDRLAEQCSRLSAQLRARTEGDP
jgi:hypothetical protein